MTISPMFSSLLRPLSQRILILAGSAIVGLAPINAAEPEPGKSCQGLDCPSSISAAPQFHRDHYNPAVVHIRFTDLDGKTGTDRFDAFLDLTLINASGDVEGIRVELSSQNFKKQLRSLYRQLSRQDPLQTDDPSSPSRQLHDLFFGSLTPFLVEQQITTLLIAADRGLQAVPFAALHDGKSFFGIRYAFSITPSLALTDFSVSGQPGRRLLAFGASQFKDLASLPLVPQEISGIGSSARKDQFLNQDFTPSRLLEKASESTYNQLHVATHAEFRPGGPKESRLHSGTGPISMDALARLRNQREGVPLDLVVFSACRTALGDEKAELGFSGLALQAGARSAIGTLWYVDDVATSAYFVQMYRYLEQGIPKAEAMKMTRQAFVQGLVRVADDQVIGANGAPLLSELTPSQQRRFKAGVSNPFYWSGIELMGTPW